MINQTIRHVCVGLCWAFAIAAAGPVFADADGQPATSADQPTNGGSDSKPKSCTTDICNVLSHITVAGGGLDTISGQALYIDPNKKLANDYLNTSSASSTGATVSYSNDGILHKDTVDINGAAGYLFYAGEFGKSWAIWADPYARVDIESTSSTIKTNQGATPTPTYSEENYEFGGVVQSVFAPGGISKSSYGAVFVSFGAQPFYEKDLLRKSELYGLSFRVTPYWDSIFPNVFNGRLGLNKFTQATDKAEGWQWAVIAKVVFDGAHYTVPGTVLAGYYPNLDYARVGGVLGGGVRFIPGSDTLGGLLGTKPLTLNYYFSDFAPLSGYHGNFANATGSISVPISSALSIALTYVNGRTEAIAAPENKISVSLKFGGGDGG